MKMTREEASRHLHNDWYIKNGHLCVYENARDLFLEAVEMGIKAIRPISRDQVEKVWKGAWIIQQDKHKEYIKKCSKCGFPISGWWGADKFCANCGEAFTDEAMQMVMERLEALRDE